MNVDDNNKENDGIKLHISDLLLEFRYIACVFIRRFKVVFLERSNFSGWNALKETVYMDLI